MKKILFLALVILFFGSFNAVKSPKIKIRNGSFTINKFKVNTNWSLKEFIDLLGKPEKEKDGFNKTHTYDNLGIILFEKAEDKVPTGKILEVQFYFDTSLEKNERTPETAFNSTIRVDALKASKKLTPKIMREKLVDWKETDSYMKHNFRMHKGDLYIYFRFNDDETALAKMSIGLNNKQ